MVYPALIQVYLDAGLVVYCVPAHNYVALCAVTRPVCYTSLLRARVFPVFQTMLSFIMLVYVSIEYILFDALLLIRTVGGYGRFKRKFK